MADSLLAERHLDSVGQDWVKTLVGCWLELKVQFNRK
jgi:hypothetical protein